MEKVLIHHAEIGLKKGNFSYFEKKLVSNIKKSAGKHKLGLKSTSRTEKRIICEFDSGKEQIIPALKNVFGIKYFAFVVDVERKIESMEKVVNKKLKGLNVKNIAFKTKRSDKNFKLNSLEINKKFGELANKLGIKVNYSNPNATITTEITTKKVYVYTERIEGYGGLPVSTGGRVLCLLSGGIDSVVAAWLMMKRGCQVDYLHFHTFNDNKKVKGTKITKIINLLNDYQFKSKLYVLPYSTYELLTQGNVLQKYDLIVFKHYILKIAEKVALENHYDAIVTGDNLAQVASQTIENLKATSLGIKIPIFRPLLTYDKQEIINLSKKINFYNVSIEKYKDCCSILSKKPSTKTKLDFFKGLVEKIDLDEIIEKTLKEIKGYSAQ